MSISGYLTTWCSSLLSLRSKVSSELHLWYAVKSPLLFLHPDNTFFLPLEASAHASPTFNFQIITQPPQHEALFSLPLLWASDLNQFFSSRTVHKLELDEELSRFYLDRAVTAFCLVNSKLCFQPSGGTKPESGQRSTSAPLTVFQTAIKSHFLSGSTPKNNTRVDSLVIMSCTLSDLPVINCLVPFIATRYSCGGRWTDKTMANEALGPKKLPYSPVAPTAADCNESPLGCLPML